MNGESIKEVAVDVTETEIERPKKTKEILLRQEKKAHIKSTDHSK